MTTFYVIGLGPGGGDDLTLRAQKALAAADIIAGYHTYTDLLRDQFPNKEYLTTGMTGEVKRCQEALARAQKGQVVAMVSSGDAGIYGMAGLVLELAAGLDLDIQVIPGVTAASAGAALLGAPLMHDFVVISLSDRLTPWPLIERRLRAAGESDLIAVLYNPRSKGRPDHLAKAKQILLESKAGGTPVGIVRNIGRGGEQVSLTTLAALDDAAVDMFTTVFIGNSQTFIEDGKLITPRGYLQKGAGERP